MKAFWDPPISISIPHLSNSTGKAPTAVIPSTINKTSSLFLVIFAMLSIGCSTPVEVSLA